MSDFDCLANARSPANRDQPEPPFHDGAWQCSDWIRNTLEDEPRVRKVHGVVAHRRRLAANFLRIEKQTPQRTPSQSKLRIFRMHLTFRIKRLLGIIVDPAQDSAVLDSCRHI